MKKNAPTSVTLDINPLTLPPKTIFFLSFTSILMVLSYFYFDKEIVWFLARHHSRSFSLLKILANEIVMMTVGFVFLFYGYFAMQFSRQRLCWMDEKIMVMCNAMVIASFLKEVIKFISGRHWPSTFIGNNLSLLEHHAYGFQWFNGSPLSLSFPSGHVAVIVAFSTSGWFLFPKLRPLWILIALCVMIGQVGMYYHFLSDVVAGALLGGLVGMYTHHYFIWGHRRRIFRI